MHSLENFYSPISKLYPALYAALKLAYVLEKVSKDDEVRTMMLENVASEFAGEIDEKSYLN